MRRLLLLAAVLLAGCGNSGAHAPFAGPPPPPLDKRCGSAHGQWRTFWFPAADGTKLDGAVLGTGPRGVVMLHESPADLCGWEPYGARLAGQGFHVLLIDLRAFGLSRRGPYGGTRGAIADVRGAVRELKSLGAKHVALVGASYGGATAMVTAPALGTDISGVASLSGELELQDLNSLAAVAKIRVPLLVVGSRKDHYLDETDANRLVRAATSTHAQLAEFNGYDHGWNLLASSHKQRANSVLVAFLRRVTQ